METSNLKTAAQFLWRVIFYGFYFMVTFISASLCRMSFSMYVTRGGFEKIAVIVFITIFYLSVSAKILPCRNSRAKNGALSALLVFLISGYIALRASGEPESLYYLALILVTVCLSGHWLSTALQQLNACELPE